MLSDAWIPFTPCVVVAMAASNGIHIELLPKTCYLQHLEQTDFITVEISVPTAEMIKRQI